MGATKHAIERLASHRIRKGDDNLDFWRIKYAAEGITKYDLYLPEDPTDSQEIRSILFMMQELEKILPRSTYTPIWPPDRIDLRVSQTLVELGISGIFKTSQNKTLHILDFTPYITSLDATLDPALALKTLALKDMVERHYSGRPQAVVHQLGFNSQGNPFYRRLEDAAITGLHVDRAVGVVKAIEAGLHWPTAPCPDRDCPLRSRCFLKV